MAGYKSKVAMSTGAFYAPYVPKTLTWDEKLLKWEARAKEKYGWGDAENVKSDCMDAMQREYPGNYKLEWQEVKPMVYHLVLKFADPKHETLWLLKYGDK